MKAEQARRAALVLLVIAGALGGLALLVGELDERERDRHAIRGLVREIERKLRAHDGSAWLLAERAFPPGDTHPAVEPAHDELRADLERLAHLEDLRLVLEDVGVQGDTAWAGYRVQGRPRRREEGAPPAGGRFTFHRTKEGWALTANRFSDGPPAEGSERPPARGRGAPHARGRGQILATRLLAFAALAVLAAGAAFLQPRLSSALRRRKPSGGPGTQ